MFSPQTITFLADLRHNNDREWFAQNRARYDAGVAGPAKAFGDALSAELARIAGVPVHPRLFRLHRDLRFSRDKTPYNAHVHMAFSVAGAAGAWLVGLEPGSLVLGYGVMGFDAPMLDRWRAGVAGSEGAALAGVLAGMGAFRLDPPELRRVPAPWPADHPRESLLRRKSLVLWDDSLAVESAFGDGAPGRIASSLRAFEPIRHWLSATL